MSINQNREPVLSITARYTLRRDEKRAAAQREEAAEAARLQERLTNLLTKYKEENPAVVEMCGVSGVSIAAVLKENRTAIQFSFEGRTASYLYTGGKAIQLTSLWGEHNIDQYAEVLHAALFNNDPF